MTFNEKLLRYAPNASGSLYLAATIERTAQPYIPDRTVTTADMNELLPDTAQVERIEEVN